MINKKIIISAAVLSICCLFGFSFAENNFITIAGGGGTANFNTTTLGQAIVFAQKTDRYIAKSGYASVLTTTKSDSIIFVDKTEQKIFESNVVPVKVEITATETGCVIDQIVYKVGNGENPNFDKIEAVEYTGFEKKATVTFEKNIDFTEGKPTNQLWLWAQYKNGQGNTDSSYIIITVHTQGTTGGVVIESPDPLTKLASTDPTIKTSQFSIDLSDVTVCLYEGNSASGTPLYSVSTSDPEQKGYIFDNENSCVSYLNSVVMEKYGSAQKTTLQPNKEYTIEFKFSNEEVYPSFTATFKVLSGGVADILTYPSPFNPKNEEVNIRYLLAKDSRVTIRIYDKSGKIVAKVIQSEQRSAGTNEEKWNGRSYAGETLATGAYIVEIIANSSSGEDRRYTALAIVGK
ncbi:MAG: hypothetical protein K5622_01135 [Endomicrobiaceae bacterium]|nr:hypothetical protein [Endomicrobiaceae bacterium]